MRAGAIGARRRRVMVVAIVPLLVLAGGAWLSLGATGASGGRTIADRAPARTGHPFPLDRTKALAAGDAGAVTFIVAPKRGSADRSELCFSVLIADGDWLFGCGSAEMIRRDGAIYVERGPSRTDRIWGYSPAPISAVRVGARQVAEPSGRFFTAAVPRGTRSVTLSGPAGVRTVRLARGR